MNVIYNYLHYRYLHTYTSLLLLIMYLLVKLLQICYSGTLHSDKI